MIKLYENGVYLLNGTEIVEDTGSAQVSVSKEEAAKNTIAYGVLEAHNTSFSLLLPFPNIICFGSQFELSALSKS